MLSGLLVSVSRNTIGKKEGESFIHRCVVYLQQVPAFQIGLDESWAQGGNEIDGRKECEYGESKGDIERR